MHGLGTIINVDAIIIGGLSVIFIGTAGALKGMFSVTDGKLVYGGDFLIIGCLALGALVGGRDRAFRAY